MGETTEVIRGVSIWKAVGLVYLPEKLLKLDHPEFVRCFHKILVKVWRTG